MAGAQAGDLDLQAFVDTVNGERLQGATMMVARLVELGWAAKQYAAWVGQAMAAAVLSPTHLA